MVANGCFLDEAFGEIKTPNVQNKGKKKRNVKRSEIEFDKNFNSMSQDVGGYIEDEEMFSEIQQREKKNEKKVIQKIESLKKKNMMMMIKMLNIDVF